MNILITNAAPTNGGDEALLRAATETILACWPDSRITTLCNNAALSRIQLPDLAIAPDLEYATSGHELHSVAELYRQADVVLSAPGGFFHDYYQIEERLRGLEFALDLGKPVVLFGQSIGPFWKPGSIRRVHEVFNRVAAIYVRDAISRSHLLDARIDPAKIHETADLAFLWRQLAADVFRTKSGPVRRIGLCFRVWPLDDTTQVVDTIAKGQSLCQRLLAEPDRDVVFLSTCQGLQGYVDDSEVASRIVVGLPAELKERCTIDRVRRSPQELMSALSECDAFIGMRLHACILAMLGGTAAMGLGYEDKTEQIFTQLTFGDYQVPFDQSLDAWLACTDRFLAAVPAIRERLASALDAASRRAIAPFEFIERLRSTLNGRRCHSFEALRETQDTGSARLDSLYESLRFRRHVPALIDRMAAVIPHGEEIIVVDAGMLEAELLDRWRPRPFVEKDGTDWGPPADDGHAVAELERQRRAGARFAVFIWPTFWWLDHYCGLRDHLEEHFVRVVDNDSLVIFDLRAGMSRMPHPLLVEAAESSPARRTSVLDMIDRVRHERLSYLHYSALVDLHTTIVRLEESAIGGVFIETGCALGGSALVIAASKAPTRPLRLYDTFGMIPPPSVRDPEEVHARYAVIATGASTGIGGDRYYGYEEHLDRKVHATFVRYGLSPEEHEISLIKGEYAETLRVEEPVAFAHIDCDWHDSVMTCLQQIEPHVVSGGTLVLDDYFRWPGCRRAVDEYFALRHEQYEFQIKSRLHIVRR